MMTTRIIRGLCAPLFARFDGGAGLPTSTLPDMVAALIRSLLPGGNTLLRPETIAAAMTNQLPDGRCIRFVMMGKCPAQVHGP